MDYQELHNLLKVNSVDMYTSYRVFLCEDKQSEYTNHEALLKPAPLKPYVGVNIREQNGRRYSENLLPVSDEREFTLYFACHGDTREELFENYAAFIRNIKSGINDTGWLDIWVADLPDSTYRCFVSKFTEPDVITLMPGNLVATKFKVTFIEPNPSI